MKFLLIKLHTKDLTSIFIFRGQSIMLRNISNIFIFCVCRTRKIWKNCIGTHIYMAWSCR
jgi:hypothetical protein